MLSVADEPQGNDAGRHEIQGPPKGWLPSWITDGIREGQAKEMAARQTRDVLVDTMMIHQGELRPGG
jgi:hypothetical protein